MLSEKKFGLIKDLPCEVEIFLELAINLGILYN